jgi:hypothetical protein
MPTDLQDPLYNEKLLIDSSESKEIVNLKEISDSLGSKIDKI